MKVAQVYNEIVKQIERKKPRSAWDKGVYVYTGVILDRLDANTEITMDNCMDTLLCGACDWHKYSLLGFAYVANSWIAKTLCTKSELKRTQNGARRPNRTENWLDVQARALSKASLLIKEAVRTAETIHNSCR